MTTKTYKKLNKDDAVMLLVDHQAGLLSLVRDIDPDKFRNNVLATADLAKYFKLPTILTISFEQGPERPADAGAERTVSGRAPRRPPWPDQQGAVRGRFVQCALA